MPLPPTEMGGAQLVAPETTGKPPAGGAQLVVPETMGKPPAGGAQLVAPETGGAAGATSCAPPVVGSFCPPLPVRRYPSHNSLMTYHDNRTIILYVTAVTAGRRPILANKAVTDCLLTAWHTANEWLVGRYIVMPDHVHFFCAPASYPPPDFHRWVKRWKSLVTLSVRRLGLLQSGGAQLVAPETAGKPPAGGAQFIAPETGGAASVAGATSCAPPARNPSLWQRDCWDRQLRTGESYAQKWEYVRNNSVRKGFVAHADEWPYQGELNVLTWHERC